VLTASARLLAGFRGSNLGKWMGEKERNGRKSERRRMECGKRTEGRGRGNKRT